MIGSSGTENDAREQQERLGLLATEPAVEADQLLERGALVDVGVVEAVDEQVGCVREPVGTQ